MVKKSDEHPKKSDTRTHDELMRSIDEKLRKKTSLRYILLFGIVRGLGAAIGATIVAAILFAIAGALINTAEDIPILRDIVDKTNADNLIKTSN